MLFDQDIQKKLTLLTIEMCIACFTFDEWKIP